MDYYPIDGFVVPKTLLALFRDSGLSIDRFLEQAKNSSSIISEDDISFLYSANVYMNGCYNFLIRSNNEADLMASTLYLSSTIYDKLRESIGPGNYNHSFILDPDRDGNKCTWGDYAMMFCEVPNSVKSEDLNNLSVAFDLIGYDGKNFLFTPYPVLDNKVLIDGEAIPTDEMFKKTMTKLFSYIKLSQVVQLKIFAAYVKTLI